MTTATFSDLQCEAVGGLLQARLHREVPAGRPTDDYCKVVLQGPLAAAPPLTAHPFVEVFRNGETFELRGSKMRVQRAVEMSVRYFLGPRPRSMLREAFPQLTITVGWMLEAIRRGKDEAWFRAADPTADPRITERHYTLAEEGQVSGIRPVRCSYAFMEAGQGDASIHPGVVMTLAVTHELTAYATSGVELLTRCNLNLNLDGAASTESGYHIGILTAVTGTEL